ncbi:Pre-mRNA-processing protein 45 [Zancudomyces culisetae]|uniref:Pre-mRNA-processing protein 45 n=1 Tax=Zancudomyces culisetae TaxID=1213189 RepID=A0A1R1PD23_ZANCU|nr:Pre-mRNA-processing protein 45 [Zancudomyces culisetae]|eukprot:OMH78762.1 Pre-mRNA-processing protein 45 [Zancudomyces culisetae]
MEKTKIPEYGKRRGWVPKSLEDFGDGGAYPEIPVAQYPLKMGLKKTKKSQNITKQVDGEGNIDYGAIARQGHGENKIIHSDFKQLVPMRERTDIDEEEGIMKERPGEEEVQETAQRTLQALEKKINGKINAAKPRSQRNEQESGATFIRYTPNQTGENYNSGAQQRVIRMSEVQVDPLEPPKFQHKRIPNAPPSPPAPVMHSPPRAVSVEEQKAWVIPPCISNWKNAKGYTIALDKRLAADGRGLQEVKINDNFAKLSEALLAAERHAREEVRQRSMMQQRIVLKEKEAKEEHLRNLARLAREERSGTGAGAGAGRWGKDSDSDSGSGSGSGSESEEEKESKREARSDSETEVEDKVDERVRERDEIRRDRQRELRRELRMNKMGAEAKAKYAARMENRDISEKIALGLAKPSAGSSASEGLFDTRLLHRNESTGADLNDDESYNIYDKPMMSGKSLSSMNINYRPKDVDMQAETMGYNEESLTKELEKDRFDAFGTKRKLPSSQKSANIRSTPVEFEKDSDIFGVDQFLDDTKKSIMKKHKNN